MTKQTDFTITMDVDATPLAAFEAIQQVTSWWTVCVEGKSQKLDDTFTVRFGEVHVSTQQLIEVIPEQKIVWRVSNSNLNFVAHKQEWDGTQIQFDITTVDGKTRIAFTHKGLAPAIECYDACSNAWGHYIRGSLYQLITTGKGQPELV